MSGVMVYPVPQVAIYMLSLSLQSGWHDSTHSGWPDTIQPGQIVC